MSHLTLPLFLADSLSYRQEHWRLDCGIDPLLAYSIRSVTFVVLSTRIREVDSRIFGKIAVLRTFSHTDQKISTYLFYFSSPLTLDPPQYARIGAENP